MWSTYSGGDGPDEETLRRITPPENEIPVALPLNTVLARTDDVALGSSSAAIRWASARRAPWWTAG